MQLFFNFKVHNLKNHNDRVFFTLFFELYYGKENKMLKKMIQNYLKQREIREKILRRAKFEEIKKATEDFYIDLENSGAKIDLPYFLKAEAILNERIKSPADIDYYFNRLIKWRSKCA